MTIAILPSLLMSLESKKNKSVAVLPRFYVNNPHEAAPLPGLPISCESVLAQLSGPMKSRDVGLTIINYRRYCDYNVRYVIHWLI